MNVQRGAPCEANYIPEGYLGKAGCPCNYGQDECMDIGPGVPGTLMCTHRMSE